MPNRILRDWTDSEQVEAISWKSEVFFVRLIMKVDDFGRYSANPKLLRSVLFPIRDGVRDSDISLALAECEKNRLIAVFVVEGKSYLQIVKFGQKPRAEKSKFPAPPMPCEQMLADAEHVYSSCNTSAPVCVSVCVSESESVIISQAKGIIEYLNEKAGTGFQDSASSLKHVLARIKEGSTPEQCKLVIDNRVSKWLHDPKMKEYLRPQTLFNSEKFSGYLGLALQQMPKQDFSDWDKIT